MVAKVSVIVPVYNGEDFLGQCLDSILTQTLEDIEVICVDDGSTDETASILQTYAFLDSRLKIITQENKGIAAARNKGMKEASGEYIIFWDSDDFFENNMLEKMLAKAQDDNSDVVMCGHYLFDNGIKEKVQDIEIQEEYLKKSPFKPEDLAQNLFDICPSHAWNKLVKKKLIEKNNIFFDERVSYAEDHLFSYCVLTSANKISLLKDCLVYYRFNTIMQASSSKKDHFLDVLKAGALLYTKIKEKHGKLYLQAVCKKIKGLMKDVLEGCSSEQKREGLLQIRQELSEEILDGIFSDYSSSDVKVSIIIPVYNAASFLTKCLDSCLNQTLKEIEIICVDDGSLDNSLEILNQYAQKDNRVIVIHQENQRQAIARNKAMDVARGQFIQFVDSDDWIDLDASECLYLYSSLFDLEMCQLNIVQHGKNILNGESFFDILSWIPNNFKPVFNKKDIIGFLPYLVFGACLTFYNHAFLTKNHIRWINKKIPYEDTPFFMESFIKAKRIGGVSFYCYHRHNHSDSTEHQVNENFDEYIEILKYTLDHIHKWAKDEAIEPYCKRFIFSSFNGFKRFEITDKDKMAPYFYDLLYFVQKKYCYFLEPYFNKWCLVYLKNKHLKEKIKFHFYRIRSYFFRNNYTINLFSYQRKPFYIKLLGIPVLYLKTINQKQSSEGIKNQTLRQNGYVRFCGLTIFKTKKILSV